MVSALGLTWTPSVYFLPTFVAGVVAAGLAVYAWRHRERRTAVPFLSMMVGLCIWSIGYGVQLGFATREPMLATDQVAFVGSVVAPTAWFVLAVEYAGYDDYLTERVLALLAVEPLVTLGLVWTNEFHGLIWRDVGVDASGPFAVLELTFGPAYWLNFAYSYLLVVAGIVLLGGVVGRATRIYRWQSVLLTVGAVVPLVANAVFHLVPALNPIPNLDPTTFAFAVTGVVYALVVFRYRMLDLVPAARERLVERMDDGALVLSDDGTVVDANPAATAALGDDAVGSHVSATAVGDRTGVREGLVTLDVAGDARSYDVARTPVTDFRGDVAGEFVVLHDITRLEVLQAQEQRLSVLNRLLRHNVRNEMNVVAGRVELLADELDEAADAHLAPIERAIDRLLAMSDHARYVESAITNGDAPNRPVDLAAVCERTVASATDAFPEAEIESSVVDGARVEGVGPEQFEQLIRALVENAVVHNPADRPRVEVAVEAREGDVRLTVADDGPGIPDSEQSILERDRETPLDHGTGLGLWLVRWIVDAADGEVRFEDGHLGGTTVVVTLPTASSAPGA